MKKNKHYRIATILNITIVASSLFVGCGRENTVTSQKTSGSRSAIQVIDTMMNGNNVTQPRRSSLLGIFVTEYVTTVPTALASEGALQGIGAQMQIIVSQQTIQDPDYELLQAFADALQVQVADLLNRSEDRQKALDTYTEAVTNVALRSNDRYKELKAQLVELKKLSTSQNRDKNKAEQELKKAIKDKDFDTAGEKQKNLTDLQATFAETDLQQKQVQSVVDTFDDLLTLYGKKIVAIQKNREPLIAGVKVVDVPGADELQILEKKRATRSSTTKGGYDSLFQRGLEREN